MTLLNKLHLSERSGTHHTLSTMASEFQHSTWDDTHFILFPELAAELYPSVAFGNNLLSFCSYFKIR